MAAEQARQTVSDEVVEAALLNTLINGHAGTDRVMQRLDDDCFYYRSHRCIYQAIRSVYNRGEEVSIVSVHVELNSGNAPQVTDQMMADLTSIAMQHEDLMSPELMTAVLLDYRKRRKLSLVLTTMANVCYDNRIELAPTMARVMADISNIMTDSTQSDYTTLAEQTEVAMQHIRDNLSEATRHHGILTSIPELDEQGGLPHGLVVMAAKSSHGKTSMANFLALNAMRLGHRVAYYSMEMSNLQITQRLLAMESGISMNRLAYAPLSAAEIERVDAASALLKAQRAETFWFDNRHVNNLDRMLQSIRALKRSSGLDLVVVDYIQLLGIDRKQRDENTAQLIGRAAHDMQQIGQELGLTILCLSQVNRNAVGIPSRSDIRDSGAIDEAADATIILYNPTVEKLEYFPSPYDRMPGHERVLLLADKFRNGGRQEVFMRFQPSLTRFEVIEPALPISDSQEATPAQQEIGWEFRIE